MFVMEKKVNITQVRDTFGDLVDAVQYKYYKLVILRHGKPAAVLVPLSVYENWKANRRRLFEMIEQMQDASGEQDPDEMLALVQEAQAAIKEAA